MERPDLYEDDLTEERDPTPEQRDDTAHTQRLDPEEPDGDGASSGQGNDSSTTGADAREIP